jgi:hypothetical protein
MPTLEDLIESHWRTRERQGATERHWCYPDEMRSSNDVRDLIPPLPYYAQRVHDCLMLVLRNCQRYELDFVDPGAMRDMGDGYHFIDAIHTAMDLGNDPRLSSIPAYSKTLRFFGDLRIFHNSAVFFFRGPTGVCAIPASELSDVTSSEITWRTGSANLPLAWQWLTDRLQLPKELRVGSPDSAAYDVFICHRSKDFEYAKRLYDFLIEHRLSTFLSEVCLPKLGSADYMKRIDDALDRCRHMVLIASSVEHILSSWVEAEWRVFINEKRSGRKTGNIVTVVVGITDIGSLPISLRYYEVIPYVPDGLDTVLPFVQANEAQPSGGGDAEDRAPHP